MKQVPRGVGAVSAVSGYSCVTNARYVLSIINQFRHRSDPRFLQNSLGTYREKCWITPLLHVLYNWRYMIGIAIVPNRPTPGVSVTWALRCVPVPSKQAMSFFPDILFY